MITVLVEPRLLGAAEAGEGALRIEGDAHHHLFRARRVAPGEILRLVDGAGTARWGEVVEVGRAGALVRVGGPAPANEPLRRVELLVPTLRPERAAWLVEKATELGAAAVVFHNSERAPRAFGGGTLARLRRVAAAAVEQCHRARLPEVAGPLPLGAATRAPAGGPAHGALAVPADNAPPGAAAAGATVGRWLLDPAAPTLGFPPIAAGPAPRTDRLLIGPEGGWAPAERAALAAAGWHPVSLGERILRIETAALAGAALLLLPPPPRQ